VPSLKGSTDDPQSIGSAVALLGAETFDRDPSGYELFMIRPAWKTLSRRRPSHRLGGACPQVSVKTLLRQHRPPPPEEVDGELFGDPSLALFTSNA
jgi:hypothetical protein